MYGGLGLGSGPASSVDNGDGTFTFEFTDGRPALTAAGPIAKQKHDQLDEQLAQQPDPTLLDAAKPGEDLRTAQAFPGVGGAGGIGKPPGSLDDASQQGQAGNAQVSDVGGGGRQGESVSTEQGLAATKLPGAVSGGAQENMAGANPQQVDPSTLSFGQGGTGGFGVYRPGSKGGWVPGAKTEHPGFQASEELKTDRKLGEQYAEEGVDKQYVAQQEKTALETTLAANRAESVGLELAQDQARMARQKEQVSARMSELDRLGDDISKEKIDPKQLFHEAGAIGTIGMAFAAAAGQFASGLTGAPNSALDTINKMVDRNIAGQNANLTHKKEMFGAKRQQLGILQQSFANENEQDAAHRVLTWKAVDAQLDAQKAKLGSAFDEAAYTQMKAGIQQKIADARGGYEKEAWTQTAISSKYAPPTQGGVQMIKGPAVDGKTIVPDGKGGFLTLTAALDDEGKDIREQGGSLDSLRKTTERMQAIQNSGLLARNDPQATAEFNTLKTSAINQINVARKQKTITDNDAARYEEEFGGGVNSFTGGTRLQTIVRSAQQSWQSNVMARGAMPATRAAEIDPKTGNMVFQYRLQPGGAPPQSTPAMQGRGEAAGAVPSPGYTLNASTPPVSVVTPAPSYHAGKTKKAGRR